MNKELDIRRVEDDVWIVEQKGNVVQSFDNKDEAQALYDRLFDMNIILKASENERLANSVRTEQDNTFYLRLVSKLKALINRR